MPLAQHRRTVIGVSLASRRRRVAQAAFGVRLKACGASDRAYALAERCRASSRQSFSPVSTDSQLA